MTTYVDAEGVTQDDGVVATTPIDYSVLNNADGAASGNAGSTPATGTVAPTNAASGSFLSQLNNLFGTNLSAANLAQLGVGAGALAGITGLNNPNVTKVGYQGGIPQLQANRTMLSAPPAGHVPGSGGINWGGDVTYVPKGSAVPASTPATTPTGVGSNGDAGFTNPLVPTGATRATGTTGTTGATSAPPMSISDMYTKLLGRAPDAAGLAYWTQQFGNTATPAQQAQFMATAQNILTKDPTLQASLAPNLMSIEDMYSKGLGRAADAPGLAYWKQQFGNYATPAQQAQFLATAKAQSAGSTPAVQQQLAPNLYTTPAPTTTVAPTTAAPVVNSAKDLYTQILGREPDAAGLAYWQSQFGTGSVTPAQQAQFLATAKDYLATLPPDQQAALAPNLVKKANQGGIMNLARGGSTGTYLQGSTDGMADELHTTIDNKQPAALSHGEFVIPADVVSHLGNGNSDAGAKKLYSMMDKIRQARTGTKKQGKQINPDKFMPGGLAQAYAAGGEVKHFATGDTVPAGTTGVDQTLASWTGDYIPNMLGQAQALANAPYQQYQGPLTAGASDLQNQSFAAGSNLQTPTSIGQAATTAGQIGQQAQGIN